jgi:hypothetical protein
MFMPLEVNPFSWEYFYQELQFLQNIVPGDSGNVSIRKKTYETTTVEGYMNNMYSIDPIRIENIPILYIDGQIWMSITPMEVQSHFMPIYLATGIVGVAGLGLGYAVQRMIEKEDVERVNVYEINEDVIQLYLNSFGHSPKLQIVRQDVRQMRDMYYDFFYADIYKDQQDCDATTDYRLLMDNNMISEYFYWTMEANIIELLQGGYGDEIPTWLKVVTFPLIDQLQKSTHTESIYYGHAQMIFNEMKAAGMLKD